MSVDPSTYRAVLSRVPTSVAVVTALGETSPCGMTIGSLGQLSLDPPLVLFCLTRTARSHTVLCAADRYCISILAHTQTAVAERFARHDSDRFRHGMSVYHGLPAVAGAAAWLLCARRELLPGGDHTLVIGEVEHAEHGSSEPLVYHCRSYRTLNPVADADLRWPDLVGAGSIAAALDDGTPHHGPSPTRWPPVSTPRSVPPAIPSTTL